MTWFLAFVLSLSCTRSDTLVCMLGNKHYTARHAAALELHRRDDCTTWEALAAGAKSPDPEIKFTCRHLLWWVTREVDESGYWFRNRYTYTWADDE